MKKLVLAFTLMIAAIMGCEDTAPQAGPFGGLEAVSVEALQGKVFTQVDHYSDDHNGNQEAIDGNIGSTLRFLMAEDGSGHEFREGGMLGDITRSVRIVNFPNALPRLSYNDQSRPTIGNTSSAYFNLDGQLVIVNWSGGKGHYSVYEF